MTSTGSADVLSLAEVALPTLGVGEILIRVVAAGVNRPDVFQRRGLYNPPPGASPVLGLEVAGYVEAIAEDVTGWQVGERICALCNGGGYAQYVSVPAGQCLPVPEVLSLPQAAALPETCFTVWSNVFDRAALKSGESLLVHGGSSGIGTTAIQMATALGATVYTTAGTDEKCQACVALGAKLAINYRQQDFVSEITAATNGDGIDVVLDMVGGEYVANNVKIAALDGRIVNIAYLLGSEVTVNMMPVMLKRLTLTGSTLRPQSAASKADIANSLRTKVWPLIEVGKIKPVIAATFALAQAKDAHRLMESSQHIGKIVLTVEN